MQAQFVNSKNHEGFTPEEVEKHREGVKKNDELIAKFAPILAQIEEELRKRGELKEEKQSGGEDSKSETGGDNPSGDAK